MKQFRTVMMSIFILMTSLIAETSFGKVQPSISDPVISNSVQYIGMKDDMLIFEVRLQDLGEKGTTLSILDEYGNEIYSERIEKSSFTKRYKIARNTMNKVQFNVKGRKQIINETFTVKYKLEEKLEVSKA